MSQQLKTRKPWILLKRAGYKKWKYGHGGWIRYSQEERGAYPGSRFHAHVTETNRLGMYEIDLHYDKRHVEGHHSAAPKNCVSREIKRLQKLDYKMYREYKAKKLST